MTLPSSARNRRQLGSFGALTSLLLSLVFPLGFLLFVLRLVVESHPTLDSIPMSALNLILHGVTDVMLVLGIPASGVAITLGHAALGRAGHAPPAQGTRRAARTGLALGYLSLLGVLVGIGFTAFWLATHHLHLV
jgi:hypothetical protein